MSRNERRTIEIREYNSIHKWNLKNWVKDNKCENCHKHDLNTQWANKSGEYLRGVRSDWMELCVPCHSSYDHPDKSIYKPHKDYLGRNIRDGVLLRLHSYAWWTDEVCNPETVENQGR